MMEYAKKIAILDRAFQGVVNVWVIIGVVVGVIGGVWLLVKLGSDPTEQARLPDEAQLANLTLLRRPGDPWLGVNIQAPEKEGGVLVTSVLLGSPASQAGKRRWGMPSTEKTRPTMKSARSSMLRGC